MRLFTTFSWFMQSDKRREGNSPMEMKENSLTEIEKRLNAAKKHIVQLWETKGYTDWEILVTAKEIDRLLNWYEEIRRKQG
jgi:hypothetical protein